MHLPDPEFLEVIRLTPLVSIDLIVQDPDGRTLLGRRNNEPAKEMWFVPGGRIKKGETIESAFERVCNDELGAPFDFEKARLLGVCNHFYDTNVFREPGLSTHYVVLAYVVEGQSGFLPARADQHGKWKYFHRTQLDTSVHDYTKDYLNHLSIEINRDQYRILNARRDSYNSLLWQVPSISLIAQAFLLTIILTGDISGAPSIVPGFLAFITAIGSIHLLNKHRYMEKQCAIILHEYERIEGLETINAKWTDKTGKKLVKQSSARIWMLLFSAFGLIGFVHAVIEICAMATQWCSP